jgi:hypothetical protein
MCNIDDARLGEVFPSPGLGILQPCASDRQTHDNIGI